MEQMQYQECVEGFRFQTMQNLNTFAATDSTKLSTDITSPNTWRLYYFPVGWLENAA
jgi:hypothetical protein